MESRLTTCQARNRRATASALFAALLLFTTLLSACGSAIGGPAWANSAGGQPTLTGGWLGEMPVGGGETAILYLVLERPPDDDGHNLTGMARSCIGNERGEFDVWGDADKGGQVADLRIRAEEDAPLWLLHDLSSRWEGDLLTLLGTYSYDPTRQHIARSDQPEPALALEMRRGDAEEFESMCAGS